MSRYRSASRPSSSIGVIVPSSASSSASSVAPAAAFGDEHEGVICAVTELRNGNVVGVCCFNKDRGIATLMQFNDTATFNALIMALYSYDPFLILIPDSMADSTLHSFILRSSLLRNAAILPVKRRTYNENVGLAQLQRFATTQSLTSLVLDSSKYVCVSCAAAVLSYLEEVERMSFAPNSLTVFMSSLAQLTCLDSGTIISLRLLANSSKIHPTRNKKSMHQHASTAHHKASLFDVINHTCTVGGARLLRSSILQPFRDSASIRARQQAVEELTSNPALFEEIQSLLVLLAPFDRAVSQSLVRAHHANATAGLRCSHLMHCIKLRAALSQIPLLAAALARCSSLLLSNIAPIFEDPACAQIIELIGAVIDEGNPALFAPVTDSNSQRDICVFSILPHINSYLDASRKIYNENLAEMREEYARIEQEINKSLYQVQHADPFDEHSTVEMAENKGAGPATKGKSKHKQSTKLEFSSTKGFHLSVTPEVIKAHDELQALESRKMRNLDGGSSQSEMSHDNSRVSTVASSFAQMTFISLGKKGTRHLVTTPHLNSLQANIEQSYLECNGIIMSILEELMIKLRAFLPWFLTLSDEISLIDLLLSFVHVCASDASSASTVQTQQLHSPFVMPKITNNGPIAFKSARHLLLCANKGSCVENSVYFDESNNCVVLTGINASGKSSFMQMIGQLVVLAQIGCFVPAQFAQVRLCDEIVARAVADEPEAMPSILSGHLTSGGSFYQEMSELAPLMCSTMNSMDQPRRLVLLDELARGTDPSEGASIAFSIIEQLQRVNTTYTLVATHYSRLSTLSSMYPNVNDLHTAATLDGDLHCIMKFTIQDGPCPATSDYGIRLAYMCGMPYSVVHRAQQLALILQQGYRAREEEHKTIPHQDPNVARKALLLSKLLMLRFTSVDSAESVDNLRKMLQDIVSSQRESVHSE